MVISFQITPPGWSGSGVTGATSGGDKEAQSVEDGSAGTEATARSRSQPEAARIWAHRSLSRMPVIALKSLTLSSSVTAMAAGLGEEGSEETVSASASTGGAGEAWEGEEGSAPETPLAAWEVPPLPSTTMAAGGDEIRELGLSAFRDPGAAVTGYDRRWGFPP